MDGKWQCREDCQWVGLMGYLVRAWCLCGLMGYLVRAWCLCGDSGRGLGDGCAVHGW